MQVFPTSCFEIGFNIILFLQICMFNTQICKNFLFNCSADTQRFYTAMLEILLNRIYLYNQTKDQCRQPLKKPKFLRA